MTRINADIPASDLCDQHLIAEYKELPRMVAFSHSVKIVPDVALTLNTGHMKSCVRYGDYLAERHRLLIQEMIFRGFRPNFPAVEPSSFDLRCRYNVPSQAWLAQASSIVRPRIALRLSTMKRVPTWTNRERPSRSYLLKEA